MRLDLLEDICTLSQTEEKTVLLVKNCLDQKFYIKKIMRDCAELQIYRQLMQHPHPGIPMLYEATRRGETCILVEEFINGTTLEYVLSERTLDDAAIHHIMRQLLSAVEHLHSLQPPIIHRDIKPGNIMVLEHLEIRLIDFEIARVFKQDKNRDTRVMGSEMCIRDRFTMEYLEELGLIKMDFLGLRNLTIIDEIVQHINATADKKLDIMRIPLDDAKTYALIRAVDTAVSYTHLDVYKRQHQQAVKSVLDAGLNGILGVVSQLFKPMMNYETAISNALGGAMYHIVTEDEAAARHAITFLKKNQSGRATFLPLTVMKPRYMQTVSYTHLDVYKRQTTYIPCLFCFCFCCRCE